MSAAAVASRVSFSFAPRGRHVAWLTATANEPFGPAGLALDGSGPGRPLRFAGVPPLDLGTQPLALDDGRALLCEHDGAAHRVLLAGARGCRTLAELDAQGLALLPAPPAADELAFAISTSAAGASTLWRVGEASGLQRVLGDPALLIGGVWLDATGRLLAANRIVDGRPSDVVAIDLASGEVSELLSVSPRSNERVLACSPATGLLAVSTDAPGRERVGCGVLGGAPLSFPAPLRRPYDCRVLGIDPPGRRLLVCEQRGACSELSLYDPAVDRCTPLPVAPGTVVGPASWLASALRVPWSAPTAPHALARIAVDGDGAAFTLDGDEPQRWAPARLERLRGPAGEIEAVVYGGASWRRSRRIVVALHGGPLDRWQFAFDALFQSLAAAGIAVVAPNQRGSTGYGSAHMLAIRDGWGRADLDDVLHLARALDAQRRDVPGAELIVLGSSYGAFLALLAAQADAQLWTAAVALAPFTSPTALHAAASPGVRRLVERLGGLAVPRDVLADAGALAATPVLLMHGADDERIPVAGTRALAARLRELGAQPTYHELPDAGHDLAGGRRRERVCELVTDFCLHRTDGASRRAEDRRSTRPRRTPRPGAMQ